jgi:hypothetical protein
MNDFYVILLFAVFGVTSFALIFTGNIRAKDNLKKVGYLLLFISILVYTAWLVVSIWFLDA